MSVPSFGTAAPSDGAYSSPPSKRRRFGEDAKFLPIAFVVGTIASLYCVYVFHHCIPLMQLDVEPHLMNYEQKKRGTIELVIFHYLTIMTLICYVKAILVHPGKVPDFDPNWEYYPQDRGITDFTPVSLLEKKKTGDRRHCKWCGKYKPDRCHHCRVCKTCILKMDHHCPWLYNCVGFNNYKFFFLLLLYSMIDLHFVFVTLMESLLSFRDSTPLFTMYSIFFGEMLALVLGIMLTCFFWFHVWLMVQAMTTIEFCEKALPKKDSERKGYEPSLYDQGYLQNVRVVLGSNPFKWFMPFDWAKPHGDGLNFISSGARLTMDMEDGQGLRRKTHSNTQRQPPLAPIGTQQHYMATETDVFHGGVRGGLLGYGSTGTYGA